MELSYNWLFAVILMLISTGCTANGIQRDKACAGLCFETIHVKFPVGGTRVDIYRPDIKKPAPLVIVAHGFMRQRQNMWGWGCHLAREGFVVAVPDLPAWSDHSRNGLFLSDLQGYLCNSSRWSHWIDQDRVGVLGFSAGGLATLLAAAANPDLKIWVGLDPVDRNGLGAAAAPYLNCCAVVITAEPSICNAHGNAGDIIAALPCCEHIKIAGAVHTDAEWPTDWLAEFFCGCSTDRARLEFRRHATESLRKALTP